MPLHRSHDNESPILHGSTSFQTIFSFLITSLFNFLQIEYQAKSKSPFDAHPLLFFAALLCLLLYSSLAARVINPAPWLRPTLVALAACLSVASLISLLLHGSCFLLYPLPILALLSAISSGGFIHRLYRQVFPVFRGRRAPSPRPPLLPLTGGNAHSCRICSGYNQMMSSTCVHTAMTMRDVPWRAEREGSLLLTEALSATRVRYVPPILTWPSAMPLGGFLHRLYQRDFPGVTFSGRRVPASPPPLLPQPLPPPLLLPFIVTDDHSIMQDLPWAQSNGGQVDLTSLDGVYSLQP